MSIHYPVLPIAGSAAMRGFASVTALVTHWIKRLVRARRNWHEATTLASLDRRMLADLGITRADLNDAFSAPFWEDPTALLRERAIERRMNRAVQQAQRLQKPAEESGFRRPPANRPARHAI